MLFTIFNEASYLNEEVSGTDQSLSVSVPWIGFTQIEFNEGGRSKLSFFALNQVVSLCGVWMSPSPGTERHYKLITVCGKSLKKT